MQFRVLARADQACASTFHRSILVRCLMLGTLALLATLLTPLGVGQAAAKTLYLSPSGVNGANNCQSSINPCASFDAAYRAAAAGDVVEAAGGTYPGQTISRDATKTGGANVVIRPALAASVTVNGNITINASYVTVQGMKAVDIGVRPIDVASPPVVTGVTLRDMDARNFGIDSASNVSVLGGDYGPASACGGAYGGSNNSIRRNYGHQPTNILIDGARIHDVQSYDLNACHIEGLAIFVGTNVTVRNTKFYGNSIYDIFLQANAGPINGVTFENNWFGAPVGPTGQTNGSSIAFSGVNSNVTLRNNSFNAPISPDDNGQNPTFTNFVISGNVGMLPWNGCALRGVTFSNNVWKGHACNSTDRNLNGGAMPYVNAVNTSALNYHLTGGVAVDKIPLGSGPTSDIDAQARPMGAGSDAGSDEMGAVTPTPTPPPTATPSPTPSPTTSPSPTPTPTVTPSPTPVPTPVPAGKLFMSPSGVDTAACTQAAPCKTLARTYRLATAGKTVELAAGSYADSSLPLDATKTSLTDVVFVPAAGASVTMSGTLHIAGRHVEMRGMRFSNSVHVDASAQDVTLRGNTLKNFQVFSDAAQAPRDISFIGGSIGPSVDVNNRIGSNGTSTTASPTNILIDGVNIHDFTASAGSGAHVECLQVWAVDGLTIRNSTFRGCDQFDVFLQKLPGGAAVTPTNIVIENNFMSCCGAGYFSIRLADHAGTSWRNVTIRNNSMDKAPNLDAGVPYSNVKVLNNIAPALSLYTGRTGGEGSLPAGVTVDYNVWYAGAKRGTHDQVAAHGYRNLAGGDFHLNTGAAAINRGDPANSPTKDIDLQARPQGTAPDAGADEAG
jgi:hypothetical protein